MRIRSVLPLLLLLALAPLAGCLGEEEPSGSGDGGVQELCATVPLDNDGVRIVDPSVDPIDDNVDNSTNPESTNVRTCSLPAIGWTPLDPDGTPHKYLGELDMRADLGIGAVAVLGNQELGRVYLVDIATDPAAPKVLSFIDQPNAYVTDVKISEDGKILYAASQTTPGPEILDTAPELIAASGFTAYNIEDPANPAYLGFVEDAGTGCHMLDPIQVAPNQDAVMCISNLLRSYLIQRDLPVLLNLGWVDFVPLVRSPAEAQALAGGAHDMTAYHESGSFGPGSYLVVSHWDLGVRVLDISNAPAITEVGAWNGEGATHFGGNVHTAMVAETAAGRFVIASPEYTQQGVVPCLWILDANDFANLDLVAEWCHPGLHESQGLYLTTHQWQVAPTGPDVAVEDVRIYLTYNHAGVWVLDLGAILAAGLGNFSSDAILGFNLARPAIPEDHVPNAILSTWDVDIEDGYLYGTDRATGLWVWHYQGDAAHAGDVLGDERLRGFA